MTPSGCVGGRWGRLAKGQLRATGADMEGGAGITQVAGVDA